MTVGLSGDGIPRLARRLSRVPVWAAIAASGRRAAGRARPAAGRSAAGGAGTGTAAAVARQRMRAVLGRPGGRGVTVTMIVDRLAGEQLAVTRSTVRRWLADDLKRGVAERVTPGFYRLRQPGDAGRPPRGQRTR